MHAIGVGDQWVVCPLAHLIYTWRTFVVKTIIVSKINYQKTFSTPLQQKNQTWLFSSLTLWCFVSLSSIALEICFLKYLLPKNLLPKGCSGKSLNGDKCHRNAKISLPQWYTMYCRVYSNINPFSFLSSFKWIQENWDPVNASNIIYNLFSFLSSFLSNGFKRTETL